MDPTAKGDNQKTSPSSPQTPQIQPGQFVVTPQDQSPNPPPANPDPLPQDDQTVEPSSQPNPASGQPEPTNFAASDQPDPTPYVAPQPPAASQDSQPSGIARIRIAVIVVGALLLIGAVAAALWFLVFSRKDQEEAKTTAESVQLEIPSPPPARTSGGFADLPPATPEALPATPSAQ